MFHDEFPIVSCVKCTMRKNEKKVEKMDEEGKTQTLRIDLPSILLINISIIIAILLNLLLHYHITHYLLVTSSNIKPKRIVILI
jgi:hypothetical protein